MSTTPLPRGPVRSVTELNRLIRALFPHRDVRLSDAESEEYAALVAEWTVAVARKRRDEVVEAA